MAAPWTLGPTLCRCVVNRQEATLLGHVDLFVQQREDDGVHGGGLAADAVEEVVIGSEPLADASGSPPTGDGAPIVSEKDSDDVMTESPSRAAMERLGQGVAPGHPLTVELDSEHPRPSLMRVRFVSTAIVSGGRGLFGAPSGLTSVSFGKVSSSESPPKMPARWGFHYRGRPGISPPPVHHLLQHDDGPSLRLDLHRQAASEDATPPIRPASPSC